MSGEVQEEKREEGKHILHTKKWRKKEKRKNNSKMKKRLRMNRQTEIINN